MQDQQRTADHQPRGDNRVYHQAAEDRPAAMPVQYPGYGGRSEGVHAAVVHHPTISPPHHLTRGCTCLKCTNQAVQPHHRRHYRPTRRRHRQADRQAPHTRSRLQDGQQAVKRDKKHRGGVRPEEHCQQTLQLLPAGDTLLAHREPFEGVERG